MIAQLEKPYYIIFRMSVIQVFWHRCFFSIQKRIFEKLTFKVCLKLWIPLVDEKNSVLQKYERDFPIDWAVGNDINYFHSENLKPGTIRSIEGTHGKIFIPYIWDIQFRPMLVSEIMCLVKHQNCTTRKEAIKSTILVERLLFMTHVWMFVVIVYLRDKTS